MNNIESDKYSMAEKILRELENIILTQHLGEFVIIPVTLNQNKSPVVLVENNLGLESWCVKHVYGYAYKTLLEIRKKVAKRKLLHEEYPHVNRLLIGALLINPDVTTFWNMRRELVCDELLSITQELKLSKLILSHKSKSNEAFTYRKWLIKEILSNDCLDMMCLYLFFNDEIKVCDMTAEKAQNNYHSWSHRIWCIERFFKVFCGEMNEIQINNELDYSENWVSTHVSEHTGFYYRQFILNKSTSLNFKLYRKYEDCLAEYFNCLPVKPKDIPQFLLGPSEKNWTEAELIVFYKEICLLLYDYALNLQLQNFFLGHESLWCHRRFILSQLFTLMYKYFGLTMNISTNLNLIVANNKKDKNLVDNPLNKTVVLPQKSTENGEKCPKILKSESDLMSTCKLCQLLMKAEKQLIEKYSKDKNQQGYLAGRHEKWIVYILGITNL